MVFAYHPSLSPSLLIISQPEENGELRRKLIDPSLTWTVQTNPQPFRPRPRLLDLKGQLKADAEAANQAILCSVALRTELTQLSTTLYDDINGYLLP